MIKQIIHIKKYDWEVHCYYAHDSYYTEEIVGKLRDLGCSGDFLLRATSNMESRKLNHGLTYSNTLTGESVLVVGLTSSPAEFLNSLTHELFHLVTHICGARRIDINSEEAAYLMGDVAMATYQHINGLLR